MPGVYQVSYIRNTWMELGSDIKPSLNGVQNEYTKS